MFKEVETIYDANLAIVVAEDYGYGHIIEKLYYKIDKPEDISDCITDMAEKVFVPFDVEISIHRVKLGHILGCE